MSDYLNRQNAEFAAKFATLEQIYNTPITGDEETDMSLVDEVFDFVALEDTKMSDKIAALKYIAPIFGEDVSLINEDYVNEMLAETASLFPNGKQPRRIERAAGIKWFGQRTLNNKQVINSSDIGELIAKCNKQIKKNTDAFYEKNMAIANKIISKLEKLSNTKIRIVSKTRKAGFLFVVFAVDGVIDIPNTDRRKGISITKHGSKEYHLFVGDLNVNAS